MIEKQQNDDWIGRVLIGRVDRVNASRGTEIRLHAAILPRSGVGNRRSLRNRAVHCFRPRYSDIACKWDSKISAETGKLSVRTASPCSKKT